ncbi:MAG TPA: ABC transporter substrate-binding protein [Solirubrobacterales bacterium]
MKVTLDGYPDPENAPVVLGYRAHKFVDAGLELDILNPLLPGRPLQYVVNRSVDVTISHLPQVALAQEKGASIVAIGSLVPEPTATLIWLPKSGIKDVADLKGKTIAIPGLSFQRDLLRSVLAQAGLTLGDVKVESVGFELVSALVSGRADAIFGATWNVEGVELETRGLNPVITRIQDLGIPDYDELVVVARRDRLAESPDLYRDFMAALEEGTAAAIEDPAEAIDVIDDEPTSPSEQATKAGVEATSPLLSTSGEIDPGQAEGLVKWMHEEEMIRRVPPVSSLLTGEYLPDS